MCILGGGAAIGGRRSEGSLYWLLGGCIQPASAWRVGVAWVLA